jgi:NADH:ubiquinone oxidoreductase subunit 3 (subunit A)
MTFLGVYNNHVTIVHHVYKKILLKNEKFENGQEFSKNGQKGFEKTFFCVYLLFCIFVFEIFNKIVLTINIFVNFENKTNT